MDLVSLASCIVGILGLCIAVYESKQKMRMEELLKGNIRTSLNRLKELLHYDDDNIRNMVKPADNEHLKEWVWKTHKGLKDLYVMMVNHFLSFEKQFTSLDLDRLIANKIITTAWEKNVYADIIARRKANIKEQIKRREGSPRQLMKCWTDTQNSTGEIASCIAEDLKKDVTWALEAIEKAKLGPHAKTLFGERLSHFKIEKEFIIEHFGPFLLNKCKIITQAETKIFLIIDSGTSTYPFFEYIAKEAVRGRLNNEEWVERVTVVTNNLPGVESLMEHGRISHSRYSPLAINCCLIPGVPLPIYSALTGLSSELALEDLKVKNTTGTTFITVMSGNWIRLRRTTPVCPIPLARGDGHLRIKQKMIDISDVIYVLCPLGKVFIRKSHEEVNDALAYSDNNEDPDMQPYGELNITSDKAQFVKMVSTSRMERRVLSNHSTAVKAILGEYEIPVTACFDASRTEDASHLLFLFDDLPNDWDRQIEMEFPHPHTRNEEFITQYFQVPCDEQR